MQEINHPKTGVPAEIKNTGRWIKWYRPSSYWDVVIPHMLFAMITGIPVIVSFLFPINAMPLIPCTFLKLTGYPCPFCGFTRAFWSMSSGDFQSALGNTPLAVLLYIVFILFFLINTTALITGLRISRGNLLRFNRRKARWITFSVFFLIILNWFYRVIMGFK